MTRTNRNQTITTKKKFPTFDRDQRGNKNASKLEWKCMLGKKLFFPLKCTQLFLYHIFCASKWMISPNQLLDSVDCWHQNCFATAYCYFILQRNHTTNQIVSNLSKALTQDPKPDIRQHHSRVQGLILHMN